MLQKVMKQGRGMAMSEFRHITTSFFLQPDSSNLVNRKEGQIVFSYPDKTTMDIFMTMSEPPAADYVARSSICTITYTY